MKFLKYDLTNVGVFGDVHAALGNLKDILTLLDVDKRRKIVSLGDIWDRGLEPNEVVDILYDLYVSGKLIPIIGNHEAKYLKWLNTPNLVMGSQQIATLSLLKEESKAKFIEIFSEEIVCIYDPSLKIFITHGPGGRPARILFKNYEAAKLVMGGTPNMTFDEFLFKESHIVSKKHISTLLYGITNGDKTPDGFPVRLPIVNSPTDELDGWKYIYGHVHANNFHPEGNNNLICLDFCSPTGKIGGCIINSHDDITLVV